MSIEFIHVQPNTWPIGISNGLVTPCEICGHVLRFDYGVHDEFWRAVVPAKIRASVICLPCLDKMANLAGRDVASAIEFVQWTGLGVTVELLPARVFYYK